MNLKTDPKLIAALELASSRSLSAAERHDQRVSFAMNSLKESGVATRELVEKLVAGQEGG